MQGKNSMRSFIRKWKLLKVGKSISSTSALISNRLYATICKNRESRESKNFVRVTPSRVAVISRLVYLNASGYDEYLLRNYLQPHVLGHDADLGESSAVFSFPESLKNLSCSLLRGWACYRNAYRRNQLIAPKKVCLYVLISIRRRYRMQNTGEMWDGASSYRRRMEYGRYYASFTFVLITYSLAFAFETCANWDNGFPRAYRSKETLRATNARSDKS